MALLGRVQAAAAHGRRAARRLRARQPGGRAACPRRRGARARGRRPGRPRLRAVPRRCPSCARRSRRVTATCTASSSTRSRSRDRAWHQDGARRARAGARRARAARPAARSRLPGLPVRRRARRRGAGAAAARAAGWAPDLAAAPDAAALYLNYPSNPCAVAAPDGVFAGAVEWAARTGGAVVHDFAYGDLVFDGRRPQSFLATPRRARGRRRDVLDVEVVRHGRLAARLRRRQRRDRRRASTS